MNIFPILSEEQFEENFPVIHQQVRDELGIDFVPIIFRCLAATNESLALSSWEMVRKTLCSGCLPRITKELIFSYIAHKQQCNYCKVAHHALALHHGFAGESMDIIFNDIELIKNPSLRLVIKLADVSVSNGVSSMSEVHEELNEIGFECDEIAEIISMISCALYMVNLASGLGVSVDQKFTDIVKKAS